VLHRRGLSFLPGRFWMGREGSPSTKGSQNHLVPTGGTPSCLSRRRPLEHGRQYGQDRPCRHFFMISVLRGGRGIRDGRLEPPQPWPADGRCAGHLLCVLEQDADDASAPGPAVAAIPPPTPFVDHTARYRGAVNGERASNLTLQPSAAPRGRVWSSLQIWIRGPSVRSVGRGINQSRHSRRAVPMTRSQSDFAFGLAMGDRNISTPNALIESSRCLANIEKDNP
jgi:hypothetical protein